MGRPAFSWRVTPGDHGTEGSEDPPTMVTAPSGAIPKHRTKQITSTPRGVGPTLSRSFGTHMTAYSDCVTDNPDRDQTQRQTRRHNLA